MRLIDADNLMVLYEDFYQAYSNENSLVYDPRRADGVADCMYDLEAERTIKAIPIDLIEKYSKAMDSDSQRVIFSLISQWTEDKEKQNEHNMW